MGLLFETEAWWTRDVSSATQGLWKEGILLTDKIPGLQMTVQSDSLELIKFERAVIKKYKTLVEEIGVLQKTVIEKQSSGEVLKEK